MKIILFILILLTLFIPFIIYLIIKTSISNSQNITNTCQSDTECPSGTKCLYNDDYQDKFCTNKKYCSIVNGNLTKCELNGKGCGKLCVNQPPFTCREVTDDNPYEYYKDGQKIKIKNSEKGYGWCLPNLEPSKSKKCNKFTSDPILVQNADKSYNWGCYCKPGMFTYENNIPLQDCTQLIGCNDENGNIHKLFVKDNPEQPCKNSDKNTVCQGKENSKCLNKFSGIPISDTDTESGYCFSEWTKNSTISPYTGFCDCPFGSITTIKSDGTLQCSKSSCSPGIKDNTGVKKCNCQGIPNKNKIQTNKSDCQILAGEDTQFARYINCPEDVPAGTDLYNRCIHEGGRCLPDPCGDNGKWNAETYKCECCPGYVEKPAPGVLGVKCVPLCQGDLNPCGNRGTCTYDKTSSDPEKTISCICNDDYTNFKDPTNTCLTKLKNDGISCDDNKECKSNNCHYTFGIPPTKIC